MNTNIKVFIAVPVYGGVSALTMGCILQVLNSGLPAQLSIYPDCALVTLARSELLASFLHSDCTHLFFIDTDISFNPMLVRQMAESGKDVVANAYVGRHPPYDPMINLVSPYNLVKGANGSKMLEIHSTGLGCCMVSRKAAEETCKLFPELEYQSAHGHNAWALFLEAIRPAPPDNILKFMGEDIMFFFRLREAGFPAFTMVDATITHSKRDFCLANDLEGIKELIANDFKGSFIKAEDLIKKKV